MNYGQRTEIQRMTREEKKNELIALFVNGAMQIGELIDECFEFGHTRIPTEHITARAWVMKETMIAVWPARLAEAICRRCKGCNTPHPLTCEGIKRIINESRYNGDDKQQGRRHNHQVRGMDGSATPDNHQGQECAPAADHHRKQDKKK